MYLIFGFSKPKKKVFPVISWLIQALERVKFSHMYCRWHSKSGAECFYHAAESMVHFLGGEIARSQLTLVEEYKVSVTSEQYRKLIYHTHSRAGTNYGIRQLIGMGMQRIFGLKRNPCSDGKNSAVCTEEMGYILKEILGYEIKGDLEKEGLRYMRDWCRENLTKVEIK